MREQRFFGQRIGVTCSRDAAGFLQPAEFVLGDEVVRIAEILRRWHDAGFAQTAPRRTWLERRHRTHYRVRAEDGRICDLYVDRSGGRRQWFLLRLAARPGESAKPDKSPPGEHAGT